MDDEMKQKKKSVALERIVRSIKEEANRRSVTGVHTDAHLDGGGWHTDAWAKC